MKSGRNRPASQLALVLHGHLPYIRHPEQPHFLEETWLFEAVTECYLPVLEVLERLAEERIPYRIAVSVSPTLSAMLTDPLLGKRCLDHLSCQIRLAEEEIRRAPAGSPWQRLATMYRDLFRRRRRQYEFLPPGGIVAAWRRLADEGHVELLASAATHAYLPLLRAHPAALQAQLQVGVDDYRRRFQRPPRGFWLPECGYEPGWDRELAAMGIRYVIVESHGILHARPRPRGAVYAPVRSASSGLAAFGRDPASSEAVWSTERGYPGDGVYRDFYRDVGFERDLEAWAPWLAGGSRGFTGLKYYRITGPDPAKEPYDPGAARRRARQHARHFIAERREHAGRLAPHLDRPPLFVAPYDAELFGHWWFEGPVWLEHVLRLAAGPARRAQRKEAESPADVRLTLTTPGTYLEEFPPTEQVQLALSSWGEGGYSQVWLDPRNDWIWRRLDQALTRMKRLAARFRRPTGLERRALNQAARELLLAQGSDWAFILRAGTAVDYARRRVADHIAHFNALCLQLSTVSIDPVALARREWRTPLFPDLDYRMFAPRRPARRAG